MTDMMTVMMIDTERRRNPTTSRLTVTFRLSNRSKPTTAVSRPTLRVLTSLVHLLHQLEGLLQQMQLMHQPASRSGLHDKSITLEPHSNNSPILHTTLQTTHHHPALPALLTKPPAVPMARATPL